MSSVCIVHFVKLAMEPVASLGIKTLTTRSQDKNCIVHKGGKSHQKKGVCMCVLCVCVIGHIKKLACTVILKLNAGLHIIAEKPVRSTKMHFLCGPEFVLKLKTSCFRKC